MAYTNFQNCTAQEYNEIIYSGDAKHKLKLLFNNIEYTNANTKTESVKITSKILSDGGDRFSLDNFKSKQVELIIHDIDLDDIIAPVSISIGTLVDEENNTYEYVPIGIFNIDETPTTDTGKTTIKLIDNSVKFDVPYDAEPIITANGGSATMLQILQDICTKCGVTLGTQTFVNYNTTVSVWDNSITARQYVMYISEKAGCIATIDRLGRLIFVDVNLGEYKNIISNENIIYINDALNRKIKDVKLLGNTEQKTTQGTNLFDYSKWYENRNNIEVSQGDITINENSIVFNNPTATDQYNRNTWHMVSTPTESSRNIMEKFGIEIEPSTKYTISYKFNNYSQVFIFFYNEDGAFISLANSAIWQPPSFSPKLIYSFTTPSNAKYLCVRFDNESYNKGLEDTSLTITNIMLAKGTNSEYEEFTNGTSPNPDYPQDIETTTGTQIINILGKNWFNVHQNITSESLSTNGVTYTINNDGTISTSGTNTGTYKNIRFDFELPAGTYIFNGCPAGGSQNGYSSVIQLTANISSQIFDTGNGNTFTLAEPTSIRYFPVRVGSDTVNFDDLTFKPMIRLSNIADDTFVAYQNQSHALSLGSTELCKIGDYQDYIYKNNGNWYLHKEIGKVVFDGINDDWAKRNNGDETDTISFTYNMLFGAYGNQNVYCDKFSYEQSSTSGNEGIGVNITLDQCYIQIKRSRLSSLDATGFKSWLNSNNVELCYPLSTPTNTLITDTTLIEQLDSLSNATLYDEINYITIDGNLSATLDLTYASENKPIEIDPLLIEQYEAGELLKISRVVYEDAIRKFDYGSDDYGTLYINSANPYIVDNTEVSNIYDSIKDFEIYSMNISKMLGNPALDSWDILQFTYNSKTYKILGQNILTYNGVITQSFDTQIGTNAKSKENVTINSEPSQYKRLFTRINQAEGNIELNASQITNVRSDLEQNYYEKSETEQLILNSSTGLTNTFSEAGGNNIFRNTGLWFEQNDENNPYEFWNGKVARSSNEKASNKNALKLQNGALSQEQDVPNGNYTVSFKYIKLIPLSVVKCYINDIEYELTGTTDTEFQEVVEVNSQHINVRFVSDTNNSYEIYDLMVNAGSVKLAYSQNQNETTTNTVNISKGITITSSDDINTVFKADYDGIRVFDSGDMGNPITKFTRKGTETNYLEAKDEAIVVSVLIQRVGDQTWLTKI